MSVEWWITPHEKTRSKLPSSNGSRSASASRTVASSPNASMRLRVVSTAQSVRSTALTFAPASANIWTRSRFRCRPRARPCRSESKSTKSENGTPLASAVRRM